ncbi:hypothetical protein [Pelagicoccus sp. SDUM812002]|uniref:hypothetical protein n=1 Tax=Pelagicoccus sp. SDUM812002 TaxID=3041266 RepID=UPI00280F8648|nr:hypothetical protein [Pelagicoccus sp. SDUM812002]MDQ8184807.1 hypothetical protein [Pelagicoccus sp. SDUM812002]
MKEKPYTFRRYIIRIFIPVAIVSIVGLSLRWRVSHEFQENNVEPVSQKEPKPIEEEVTFSEENRAHVVSGLKQALTMFESSEVEAPEAKLERLRGRIEALEEVDQAGWENAVDQAYEALAAIRDGSERSG